jgi:hypothetical protein
MHWTNLVQDREQCKVLVNAIVNLWVPQSLEYFLNSHRSGCSSRRSQLHEVS